MDYLLIRDGHKLELHLIVLYNATAVLTHTGNQVSLETS